MVKAGQTFVGKVPFHTQYISETEDRWQIGVEDNGDDSRAWHFGRVEVRVVEVVATALSGILVVYYRDFFDPEGERVNSVRRRIGSLASVKGYISARRLELAATIEPSEDHVAELRSLLTYIRQHDGDAPGDNPVLCQRIDAALAAGVTP